MAARSHALAIFTLAACRLASQLASQAHNDAHTRCHHSVVAMAFHTATIFMSVAPLAAGWPQPAVVPSLADAGLLLAIAVTSFGGQLLLTRGFQLQAASKAASINFSQVRVRVWVILVRESLRWNAHCAIYCYLYTAGANTTSRNAQLHRCPCPTCGVCSSSPTKSRPLASAAAS